MSESVQPLDDLMADPLVLGVVNGDRPAWFQLSLYIEDWVEEHVPRHWRMRKARLANSEDDVRDVLLATLERVDRDDFRALRQYLAHKLAEVPDVRAAAASADSQVTFVAWLAGLVDFAIRDHVRKRYGRSSAASGDAAVELGLPRLSKRSLQSWAVRPSTLESGQFGSANAGLSRLLTARSILSYAAEAFDAQEAQLFQRYLEHATFEELAEEFSLASPELARAEVRRLKERLRARFREPQ